MCLTILQTPCVIGLRIFNVPLHDSPLNASSSLRLSELYFSASNVNTRRNSSKVGLSSKKNNLLSKINHLLATSVVLMYTVRINLVVVAAILGSIYLYLETLPLMQAIFVNGCSLLQRNNRYDNTLICRDTPSCAGSDCYHVQMPQLFGSPLFNHHINLILSKSNKSKTRT